MGLEAKLRKIVGVYQLKCFTCLAHKADSIVVEKFDFMLDKLRVIKCLMFM